jgi:hypothetical protein
MRLAEVLRRNDVAADLHRDPDGPAFVTFRDPGNIQWEFFEQTRRGSRARPCPRDNLLI